MALFIDKACDVTPFCDVEATRYAINGVYWDAKRRAFAATDSRCLAVVAPPVPECKVNHAEIPDGPAESVIVPATLIASVTDDCRKQKRSDWRYATLANGDGGLKTTSHSADGAVVRSGKAIDGKFPDWHAVLPKRSRDSIVIEIDPKFLLKVAKYFTDNQQHDDRGMLMTVSGEDQPVEFSGNVGGQRRAHIIVMPLAPDCEKSSVKSARESYGSEPPATNKKSAEAREEEVSPDGSPSGARGCEARRLLVMRKGVMFVNKPGDAIQVNYGPREM